MALNQTGERPLTMFSRDMAKQDGKKGKRQNKWQNKGKTGHPLLSATAKQDTHFYQPTGKAKQEAKQEGKTVRQ